MRSLCTFEAQCTLGQTIRRGHSVYRKAVYIEGIMCISGAVYIGALCILGAVYTGAQCTLGHSVH